MSACNFKFDRARQAGGTSYSAGNLQVCTALADGLRQSFSGQAGSFLFKYGQTSSDSLFAEGVHTVLGKVFP
jgi:hypothetical protein